MIVKIFVAPTILPAIGHNWLEEISKNATCTETVLKKNKYYNVRIRSYEKVGSKKYYSAWSKLKVSKIIVSALFLGVVDRF